LFHQQQEKTMKKSMRLAAVCLGLSLALGYSLSPSQATTAVQAEKPLLLASDNPVVLPPLPPAPPPPTMA
jgi:hypothetical protein